MKKLFLGLGLLSVAVLVVVLFFFSDGAVNKYKVEENFIHGIGVGKFPNNVVSERQAKLLAQRAAIDNAKFQVLKAVYEQRIDTFFVNINSAREENGKLFISGTVMMPETVKKEVKNGKVIVEIRVPTV